MRLGGPPLDEVLKRNQAATLPTTHFGSGDPVSMPCHLATLPHSTSPTNNLPMYQPHIVTTPAASSPSYYALEGDLSRPLEGTLPPLHGSQPTINPNHSITVQVGSFRQFLFPLCSTTLFPIITPPILLSTSRRVN